MIAWVGPKLLIPLLCISSIPELGLSLFSTSLGTLKVVTVRCLTASAATCPPVPHPFDPCKSARAEQAWPQACTSVLRSLALSALSFSDPRDDNLTPSYKETVQSRALGVRLGFAPSAQKPLPQAAPVLPCAGRPAEQLPLLVLILLSSGDDFCRANPPFTVKVTDTLGMGVSVKIMETDPCCAPSSRSARPPGGGPGLSSSEMSGKMYPLPIKQSWPDVI